MNMGQYAHGNQPIQHAIYLYNYAGSPWKAQYWLRQVMDRLYSPEPDGLCGDEDNGQTSAWYVLSSLGFYSVCPGQPEYVIGSPLFDRAIIHLENGNSFVMEAKNNDRENYYIQSATFNGRNYTKNYLTHEDISRGGEIIFGMGPEPNEQRGTGKKDVPYSMTKRK
jgi:predicted alpha-1,2-mannosidase